VDFARIVAWFRESTGWAHRTRVATAAIDPWQRFDLEPPLRAFGPGAEEFRQYLERETHVAATTPQAIGEYLLACHYAEDVHLLDEHDAWLHPATFELLRAGDCEDFALWAWRKLLEAGYDAVFVVGMRCIPETPRGRHAWVMFRDGKDEFLLDGVERTLPRMVRPLHEVRESYEPQVGVAAAARRFVYAGLYREAWGRALRLRPVPRRA